MNKSGTFHGERIFNRRIPAYKNYYQLESSLLSVLSRAISDKEKSAKAVIVLKNGSIYEMSAVDASFRSFGGQYLTISLRYLVYDKINEKVVMNLVPWREAKQILGDEIGDVTIDPNTNEKFPPNYRFIPYTGQKLLPGMHGNAGPWCFVAEILWQSLLIFSRIESAVAVQMNGYA